MSMRSVTKNPVDTTIYPDTDDMGEGELQMLICELLRPLLQRFLAERVRGDIHVGKNQFLYYVPRNSAARIAPDIYVLPDIPQSRVEPSWKLWEVGPPSFCLEVVSSNVNKDYAASPTLNNDAGTRELVIFDPAADNEERWVWQIWRRSRKGAALSLVEQTNEDRVRSVSLGCFLRTIGTGGDTRVRIATGFGGRDLFPTDAERAAQEAERATQEAERAARAERRIQELEGLVRSTRKR